MRKERWEGKKQKTKGERKERRIQGGMEANREGRKEEMTGPGALRPVIDFSLLHNVSILSKLYPSVTWQQPSMPDPL